MFALPPQTFRWSDPHSWPWVFYVWMLFYFCSLALLYSAIRSRTATGFSSQYAKCPQCGEPTHYASANEDFSHS
jgi:hypothetical protein